MAIEATEVAAATTEAGKMAEEHKKASGMAAGTEGMESRASGVGWDAGGGAENERRRSGGAKGPTRFGNKKNEAAAENGGTEATGGKPEVEDNERGTSKEDSTVDEATSG